MLVGEGEMSRWGGLGTYVGGIGGLGFLGGGGGRGLVLVGDGGGGGKGLLSELVWRDANINGEC